LHGSAYVFALVCNVVPTFFRVVFVKNKKIWFRILSENIFLNETKNHNRPPPCKLNGRTLTSTTKTNTTLKKVGTTLQTKANT
jgi:hypothetical protein